MPSEMAVMLSVDVRVAERFAGNDNEARLARSIMQRARQCGEDQTTSTTSREQS